jgi:UTP--glucose-1-phosphate uridylyltransferase
MLPVVDMPLIEYAVEEARLAGIEEFIFVTGRGKTAIQDHFDSHIELEAALREKGNDDALERIDSKLEAGQVAFVRQMEPLGLGHAVWCARNFVKDEPFAVLLADDLIMSERPLLAEMVEVHEETGGNVIALMEVPKEDTSRYGVISPGESSGRRYEVLDLVEKPEPADAPSNLAIVGRYVLQPEIMEYLSLGSRGAGGEIQLTDSMVKLIGSNAFTGLTIDGTRFDCGTKLGFLEANVAYALQRDDMGDDDVRGRLEAILKRF